MKRILETERLSLREMERKDKGELIKILGDPESMRFYPEPFSDKKVEHWIEWNRKNYEQYGHGLWAEKCGMEFVRSFDKILMGVSVGELLYRIDRPENL